MSSKTQNKDGRNIDKAYFDESHDAQDDEIAAACQKSMSVKDEPMFINLTTEGFVNEGYLDNKLIYARKVLNDEIEDDTFLAWLYTQDSEDEIWQDEQSWYKSNPSLGSIKKWSYLRGEISKSKVDKSTRMHTLCKDFNIKQNNAQAWLMREDYDYETEIFDLEEFRGALILGSVDLASTTDLTNAKIFLMKPNDKTKYIYNHYWIPESKLENSDDKEAGANYSEWAKEGLLTIQEGNEIDTTKMADWFYQLHKDYALRLYKCGYDQRYAKDFLNRMDEYGFDCEMIYQNRFVMSSPMKLVEADLKDQLINYNQNDMDKWCLGNAAMEMDNLGNVMCVKVNNQKSKRIDGAVNLIILYEVFRRYRSDFMSQVK
jgi:phage terminase large subunit-like protein